MIFVYPSIISENVPNHMYPILAKTLEQYYLLHLTEAFASGVLRVKTVYNSSKKVYGPLLLEHKATGATRRVLREGYSDIKTLPTGSTISGSVKSGLLKAAMLLDTAQNPSPMKNKYDSSTSRDVLRDAVAEMNDNIQQVTSASNAVTTAIAVTKNDKNKAYKTAQINGIKPGADYDAFSTYLDDLDIASDLLNSRQKNWTEHRNNIQSILQQVDKDAQKDKKSELDSRKYDDEAAEKKASKARVHGSYTINDTGAISLQPTMNTVRVKIHYVGGQSGEDRSAGGSEFQDLVIGVKTVPMEIANFDSIEHAILDDFFANKSSMMFKKVSRTLGRGVFRFMEKAIRKLSGKDVNIANMIKDPAKRMILLSPQGFVNASSFKKNSSTAQFYNFASASVMFRSDDLSYDDGANFFKNKTQMRKMFKAGWNTFVVLNEIDEVAYFVSSLDGGQLHTIPYSYMFNALKMDKIYDSDEFKRRTKVFQMRSGNMGTLANKLDKQHSIFESIKRINR